MTQVHVVDTSETPAGAGDGDVVVRRDGDQLTVGEVRGGQVEWAAESVPSSALGDDARSALDGGGGGEAQTALLVAVQGIRSAMENRGG